MFKNLMKLLTVLSFAIVFNVNSIGRDWRAAEEAPKKQINQLHQANQLLIDSAATGNLKGVQEALEQGANINYEGSHNLGNCYVYGAAVLQATFGGHLNIVKFLIEEKGVNPNILYSRRTYEDGGIDLFKMSIMRGHYDIAEYLMQNGLQQDLINYNYGNPENLNTIKFLIWNGVPHRKKGQKDLKYAIAKIKRVYLGPDLVERILEQEEAEEEEDRKESEEQIREMIATEREIKNLLEKFALKVDNLKNKSYKDMVKKVNQYRRTALNILKAQKNLPTVLEDIVAGYGLTLFPETPKEFFELSEEDVNELINSYIEVFETEQELKQKSESTSTYKEEDFDDQGQDACVIM